MVYTQGQHCIISPEVKIEDGVEIGHFVTIKAGAEIGTGCIIANNVTVHSGTKIGKNVRIDDNVVIGKRPMKALTSATTTQNQELAGAIIDDSCLIGTNAVIYAGSKIGSDCLIADFAEIREDVTIGDKTIVGCKVVFENKVTIGERCKIQTGVHLVPYTKVGNRVFLAPQVHTANDNYLGRTEERRKHYRGPIIEDGVRVGLAANLLPNVVIGKDAVIGAGSVVTKDVPARKVAYGCPAKIIRDVPEEELIENQ